MSARIIPAVIILVATACAAAAQNEIVQGQSRELGIEFKLLGDENWCHPTVGVHLEARHPSAFNLDNKLFLRALGRIRAIIQDECPAVENITIEGAVRQRPVFAAESSRLLGWRRYIPLSPVTGEPYCPAPLKPGAECNRRLAAYAIAKRVMRGDPFADTELTTALNGSDEEYLVWRSVNAVGKLRIETPDKFPGLSTSALLAETVIGNIADGCAVAGGVAHRDQPVDFDVALAQRGVTCVRNAERDEQNAVLIQFDEGRFVIISLWSDQAPRAAGGMAKILADSIRQVGRFAPKSTAAPIPPAAGSQPGLLINPVLRSPGAPTPNQLPRKIDPLPQERRG